MRVYRAMTQEELLACMNQVTIDEDKSIANIGNNTFHYDNNITYMHFFKYIENAKSFYYASNKNPNSKKYDYIAVFDIPKEILDRYKGYGFYYGIKEKNGMEIPAALPIPEFAIPRKLILSQYLIDAKKDLPIDNKKTIQYHQYCKYIKYLKNLYIKYHADRDKVVKELLDNDLDFILNSKKRQIKKVCLK